jgi:hypothetical protein
MLAAFRAASHGRSCATTSGSRSWTSGRGTASGSGPPASVRRSPPGRFIVDAGDNGSFDRSDGGAAMIEFMTENEWPPGSPDSTHLVVTNPDQDHYGGAQALALRASGPTTSGLYADPGSGFESAGYNTFHRGRRAPNGRAGCCCGLRGPLLPGAVSPAGATDSWSSRCCAADENAPVVGERRLARACAWTSAGCGVLLTGDMRRASRSRALAAMARPERCARERAQESPHHGSKNNSPADVPRTPCSRPGSAARSRRTGTRSCRWDPGNTYGHPESEHASRASPEVCRSARDLYRTDRGDAGQEPRTSGPGDDHVLLHGSPLTDA